MRDAAIYFLKYQGQRATEKQIANIIRTIGPNIIAMATQRGYKPRGES